MQFVSAVSEKPKCLFCDNNSGSGEHLWPKWVHERIEWAPLRHQIGQMEAKILDNPQIKVKTVCGQCNNGWMSDLENDSIPVIGSMLQGLTVPIREDQQRLISAWAVKTAIMMDSLKGRDPKKRFYLKEECVSLRLHRTIPAHTRVWLGHYNDMGLGAFGTDFTVVTTAHEQVAQGMATTIVAGHLALQVVSVHHAPEYIDREIADVQPKAADWESLLVQTWPMELQYVTWPPNQEFANKGRNSIGGLMERWKIGSNVGELPPLWR
jgi:hypothetical protein